MFSSAHRAVVAILALTSCMISPVVVARDEVGPGGEDGQVVLMSNELFDLLNRYEGHGEENLSFQTYMVKHHPEEMADWGAQTDRKAKIGLLEFVETNFPVEFEDQEELMQKVGTFTVGLAIERPDIFNTWQVQALEEELQLEPFMASNHKDIYYGWQKSRIVPSEDMCLMDYVEKTNRTLLPEVKTYMIRRYGTIIDCWWFNPTPAPAPTPPPEPDCECEHWVTFDNTHTNLVSGSGSDTSGDVQHNWWSEEWKAAHYGELYAYIWKEPMTTFSFAGLNNENEADVRYKLSCTDSQGRTCGKCAGKLDQYVRYGSEIQVHNDGKAGIFRPLRVKASAGDSAKMTTTLASGDVVGFEKAGVMTISSKDTYDGKKVINIIKNVISIVAGFATGGTTAGITAVTKLGADTVKNFFGIVKYEGTKGTKSAELKVTFDSISDATDPTHTIESNIPYTTTVKSAGSVDAEMKGKWAKTNNSFYGSGFVIAIGVHSFFCDSDDDVKTIPGPAGAWSYANTYRSPYPSTSGLATSAASFIQQATGHLPNTASSHQGAEEF